MSNKRALKQLADEFGYADIIECIEGEGWATGSVVAGACRKGCGFVEYSMEPDAIGYTCEEGCGDTVDSVLILLGVI